MRKEVAFGVLGQLINSATNLGLQLALIVLASKEDYGWYVLIMSYFYLGLGIQNAMVNTPLAVVLGKEGLPARFTAVEYLSFWIVVVALLSGLGLSVLFNSGVQGSIVGSWGVGLAFASFWVREFFRSVAHSVDKVQKSVVLDVLNAILLLAGMLWLHQTQEEIRSSDVFKVVGLANLVSILPWVWDYRPRIGKLSRHKDIFDHAKWALPGVLVIWVQNNAYLTLAQLFWGAKVVADLGASRLIIMPIATVFSGWSRVFLNKAAGWVAGKKYDLITNQLGKINKLLVVAHLLLIGLFFAFSNTEYYQLLQEAYQGLDLYVYAWLIFSAIVLARGTTTFAIQAFGGFDFLFKRTLVSVIFAMVAIGIAILLDLPVLMIAALACAELFLLVSGWMSVQKRVKAQNLGVTVKY